MGLQHLEYIWEGEEATDRAIWCNDRTRLPEVRAHFSTCLMRGEQEASAWLRVKHVLIQLDKPFNYC